MTATDPKLIERASLIAEQAYSAGNLVTCDGYYEFDLDAAATIVAAAINEAVQKERAGMFSAPLNDDLQFILGQPCFTFIRHAQIWRAAGHAIPHRAEDEQAFFIARMLHHYFTAPGSWHDAWADEIEAAQKQAAPAIEAHKESQP